MAKPTQTKNKSKSKGKKSSVKTLKLKGSGDYVQEQPGIIKQLGSLGIDALAGLGDMYLPGIGAIAKPLGKKALDAFAKLTGFGDYTVSQNSIIGQPNVETPRAVFGHGSERIKDSEFVQFLTFSGKTDFLQVENFLVNPMNSKLFPKLSKKAALFQQYFLHGAVFRLESTCSDSVTLTNNQMAIPVFMVVSNYDVNAPRPTSSKVALNQFFASSARCNKDLMHPIECDPALQPMKCLYLWDKTTATKDQNLYNSCNTYIFSEGGVQNSPVTAFQTYKLFIDYDVELIKPKIYGTESSVDKWQGTIPLTGLPFGAKSFMEDDSEHIGHPQYQYTFDGQKLTFDSSYTGQILLSWYTNYSSGTPVNNQSFTPSGGVSAAPYFLSDTISSYSNATVASDGWMITESFVCVNGGTITLPDITDVNWSSSELIITLIEGDI